MTLQGLPVELLSAIISNLPSKKDLDALSRTHRQIRRVVEPYLYKDVRFSCCIAWIGVPRAIDFAVGMRKVLLFLRTILLRPELAVYVLKLELVNGDSQYTKLEPPMNLLRPSSWLKSVDEISIAEALHNDLKLALVRLLNPATGIEQVDLGHAKEWMGPENVTSAAYVRRWMASENVEDWMTPSVIGEWMGPEHIKEWMNSMFRGDVDAFLALLFKRLTHLTTIRLDATYRRRQQSRYPILVKPPAYLKCLPQSLREIIYDKDVNNWDALVDHEHEVDSDYDLLGLPAINSLEIILQQRSMLLPDPITRLAQSPTLTSLILRHCQLDSGSLGLVLKSTPNLRSLEINFSFGTHGRWVCDLFALGKVLECVRASLERLILSFQVRPYADGVGEIDGPLSPNDVDVRFRRSLVQLRKFHRLTELEIPFMAVVGPAWNPDVRLSDVLPRNLQQLCLSEDLVEIHEWYVNFEETLCKKLVEYMNGRELHAKDLQTVLLRTSEINDDFVDVVCSGKFGLDVTLIGMREEALRDWHYDSDGNINVDRA